MEIDTLKLKRRGNRSAVTRHIRKLEELMENADSVDFNEDGLLTMFETLTQKRTFLENIDEHILELTDPSKMEDEIMDTDEYSVGVDTKIRKIRKFVKMLQTQETQASSYHSFNPESNPFVPMSSTVPFAPMLNTANPQSPHPSYNYQSFQRENTRNSTFSTSNNHRLPKLSLPTFSGNILEWQTFWDSFESAVHLNETLSNIQKFNYLKSQLERDALRSISGFAITNANYDEAVSLLKQRFGQDDKVVNAYMQALLEILAPRNHKDSLRNFYDQIESYVRGLDALGQSQITYGKLLVPIILKKLPGEIRRNLACEHRSNTWELQDLRKSILDEIDIMDAGLELEPQNNMPTTSTFFAGANSQKTKQAYASKSRPNLESRPCVFCHNIHSPTNCTKIQDPQSRMNFVKRNKLCFNCLGNHRINECKSRNTCRNFSRRHHTSLCTANQRKPQAKVNKRTEGVSSISNNRRDTTSNQTSINLVNDIQHVHDPGTTILYTQSTTTHSDVLLKTVVAPVGQGQLYVDANILLDEGAQRSFITEDLALKLNLYREGADMVQLSAFGGDEGNVRHLDKGTVYLKSINGQNIPIKVLIVPKIAMPIQCNTSHIDTKYSYLRGLKLAHPMTKQDAFEISVLIGADHYFNIVEDRVVRGDGPTAVASKIGYLLSGPIHSDKMGTHITNSMFNVLISHKVDERSLEKFWDLESMGVNIKELDENDEQYIKNYQENSIEFRDNKYIAKLPWKANHPELPSNFAIAKKRTENVIKRLSQTPELLSKYGEIIREQERRNFIEKVHDTTETSQKTHYISHHPVKKHSATTPIRIVYDCSCRQSNQYPSLNDCLMDTPPQLNDLTKLLMRFRAHPIAMTTDIEKAFLHVGLHEEDRDSTRFLWLSDPTDPSSALQLYRFKSVLFGATSSPFILNATILKHLHTQNTETSAIMERDLYVDNVLTSVKNKSKAEKFFRESRKIMADAGFNLRSWTSNCERIRNLAKKENVFDKEKLTKVLGLLWNTESDTLMYQKNKANDPQHITKREILRCTSSIYDPLGILSPVMIKTKNFIQQLWKEGLDWDEPVPEHMKTTWENIAGDLEKSTATVLPRCYFANKSAENVLLHVFCDASPAAYISDGKSNSLVMAKTRVAPLKTLTIPQLELMGAVIAARLAKHVYSTLECEQVILWSDNTIVLNWLKSTKPLKRFIANRIKEIQTLTTINEWRYCPTEFNPADLITRGLTADQYKDSDLWKYGPPWLTDRSQWPDKLPIYRTVLTIQDDKCENDNLDEAVNEKKCTIGNVVDISKYGSLRKLIRVTAYVQRFVYTLTHTVIERKFGSLSTKELNTAIHSSSVNLF